MSDNHVEEVHLGLRCFIPHILWSNTYVIKYLKLIGQAAAKGKTETSDLKEYLAQNLKDIPIYTDSIFE